MAASPGQPGAFRSRTGARVLLVDAHGRLLMLRGHDPARPEIRYWFTVGGGGDPGETSRQAAARELAEETGLVLAEEELGEPVWHDVTEFPFDGRWYRQQQDWFLVRVPEWRVSTDGWDETERRTVDQVRWWSAEELESTGERWYPAELPGLLRRLLRADPDTGDQASPPASGGPASGGLASGGLASGGSASPGAATAGPAAVSSFESSRRVEDRC